jgi:glycine cleavage system protein P-like pyridoxal-binding family
VSVQPNAGSQGEFAGLLSDPRRSTTARRRHRERDRLPDPGQRRHGTERGQRRHDAGCRVVVVEVRRVPGNVDVDDLRAKGIDEAP